MVLLGQVHSSVRQREGGERGGEGERGGGGEGERGEKKVCVREREREILK